MSETQSEGEPEGEDVGETILERLDELLPELADGIERLKTQIVEDSDDEEVIETAEEIWGVLDETEDVLDTLDLEEVPDVIEFDELPDAVDVEEIPEAIADGDAHDAIDLTDLKDAIRFRELWEAADIGELREQQADLRDEIDDVTGDDADNAAATAEDEDDGLLDTGGMGTGGAHMQFDPDDRQEAIENVISTAVDGFRTALLETHDKLRLLYEFNQEKLGGNDSLNPTAVSTMPDGPLANSASTRHSTVPSQVKYSRAKNPRRIYGRRFDNANTE
ncbi:hypothetical protein [Halalkalicoccus subterraneus]|uniref:hypothetical protein n=1 Tax=Halalkalicoccus subterraneus TaxID=2675002 RepID=UPI000EFB2228|nr:hypothetical protein [Halalkalicoccus subterraneus]